MGQQHAVCKESDSTKSRAHYYLVDQLEGSGYVERVPSSTDGRAVIVRRTKSGWAYNRAALEEVTAVQSEWTALLGRAKMARLTALLRELSSKLGLRYEGSVPDLAAPGFPTSRVGFGGLGHLITEPDRSAHDRARCLAETSQTFQDLPPVRPSPKQPRPT